MSGDQLSIGFDATRLFCLLFPLKSKFTTAVYTIRSSGILKYAVGMQGIYDYGQAHSRSHFPRFLANITKSNS